MHCGTIFECPPICQVVEIELMTSRGCTLTLFEKKGIKEGNNRSERMDMA